MVGDLALSDNLHIDGHLEGSIRSDAEVSVGEQGSVEGEAEARRILISGRFQGSIEAERLEIAAGGHVDGDVVVGELVIESGAQFNGSSKIRGKEAPRQIGHDKNDKANESEAAAEKNKRENSKAKTEKPDNRTAKAGQTG